MRTILIQNPGRIKKAIKQLKKLKVKKKFIKNKFIIDGDEIEEYSAEQIIMAIDFGFDPEDAILLLNPEYVLEFINVKSHTRRNNLQDVRARVIGVNGKAKRTIENLAGAAMSIQGNKVGVIVRSDHLSTTLNAIRSLIQGAKHSNVFTYLEKQNANLRRFDEEDFGLKEDYNSS